MKKLLAVGVIVLFLGVAIAPSINADIGELSVDNTLVEISPILEEDEDCGCDDVNSTRWGFPVLCTLLYPLLIVSFVLVTLFSNDDLYHFTEDLGRTLNCYWANPNPEI